MYDQPRLLREGGERTPGGKGRGGEGRGGEGRGGGTGGEGVQEGVLRKSVFNLFSEGLVRI